jgi:crotonobetainyl-CoA:carnitine CoA-transferase CaiB-like acyl-CoA transferase
VSLPLAGVTVLDLTRVLAGPVCTRILAFLGADVLRVDSPRLLEFPEQHLDTGFGKRSALLDLRQPGDLATFERLLAGADVVVTGYRPGALDALGLHPRALLERRPGLVVASLSAWGRNGPWADRRGFDSLVQAASGIGRVEGGDAERPGALPAQALDHGTGYLLAAAVLRALALRATRGGTWRAQLSLAQTAHWLLGAPRDPEPGAAEGFDPTPWLATVDSPMGRVTHALPPIALQGGPRTWAEPVLPWGSSPAFWR